MSTTSKHPRDADASDADASAKMAKSDRVNDSPPPSSSLATFWDLPFELRSATFELACKEQDNGAAGDKGARLSRLDRRTLLSLMLVSRGFHSTCFPILYRDVKITQPSMLVEFHQSLILRPSNALHVKSLHLGPLTELPQGWWPTRWIRDPLYSDELDFDEYGDTDEPYVLVNTSLISRDDAIRPRWCKPGQEWVHESPWGSSSRCPLTCQDEAVTRAIKAALRGVGISLYKLDLQDWELADAEGDFLSINVWTSRLFEAQAIVDLYLAEMRRIEEAKKRSVPSWRDVGPSTTPRGADECRSGRCAHYPRLDLAGFQGRRERKADAVGPTTEAEGSSDSEDDWDDAQLKAQRAKARKYRFTITLDQVKKHLGRRGTQVDHFDHPLLFARGGQQMLTLTPESRAQVVHGKYPYETRQRFYEFECEDVDEFDGESKSLHVEFHEERLSDSDFEFESSCSSDSSQSSPGSNASSGPTLDPPPSKNVMELGRSILQLVHAVKNLSLTSYLARCIEPEGPSLSEVRCLSLGPLQPPEYISPCLANLKTPSLERLRVCGGDLSAAAAEALGNPAGELTELRQVVWDYGALSLPSKDRTSERGEFLVGVLRLLQGGLLKEAAGELDGSNWVSTAVVRAATEKDESPQQPSEGSGNARSIEARLHPDLLALVLEHAPSPEARAAWLDGSLLAGAPNHVRVLQSRAAVVRINQNREVRLQDTKLLLEESEEWWEESAVECSQTMRATV